jgi:hypothetical protein
MLSIAYIIIYDTSTPSVNQLWNFHGFLNSGNLQKPAKTCKKQDIWKFGNLCPFSQKPHHQILDGNLR